jgi:hypothetical protein
MKNDRDLKRIEHRRRCRICFGVAQLKRVVTIDAQPERRYYCPLCYRAIYQTPAPNQALGDLTPRDLVTALHHNVVTGRAAAELLDRILKERTV